MGVPVFLIGKSGSGKSTSMRNFGADEIGLINVSRKPLPFRHSFTSTLNTDDYGAVMQAIARTQKTSIVIDDAGYLIVNMFMKGHASAGTGNAIFGFYNQVGDSFWHLVEFIKSLPPYKIVYTIMHEDKSENGDVKPKTIGKILDEKVCLEGMFTIVLRSIKTDKGYIFRTQTDGFDVCKSPEGMFPDIEIPNDLKTVDTAIREYWGLQAPVTPSEKETKA